MNAFWVGADDSTGVGGGEGGIEGIQDGAIEGIQDGTSDRNPVEFISLMSSSIASSGSNVCSCRKYSWYIPDPSVVSSVSIT